MACENSKDGVARRMVDHESRLSDHEHRDDQWAVRIPEQFYARLVVGSP